MYVLYAVDTYGGTSLTVLQIGSSNIAAILLGTGRSGYQASNSPFSCSSKQAGIREWNAGEKTTYGVSAGRAGNCKNKHCSLTDLDL